MKYSFLLTESDIEKSDIKKPVKKSTVNVTIDQNVSDDFSDMGNVSPRTVYARRLQVKLIKQILAKCPTAKAFRDVFLESPIGSMRRLCSEITDQTPLNEYIDFLQYKVVRWSMRDKLIRIAVVGFFGTVIGTILSSLAYLTGSDKGVLPDTFKGSAAVGAGVGALLGGTTGAIAYDLDDNDSVEKSIK